MGDSEKVRFTTSELKGFNGRDGKPTYVAFEGKVYDVSGSSLWASGRHMGVHSAGNELTGSIANAPHDVDLLSRFPVVGEHVQEEPEAQGLAQRIAGLYPHPMIVHFPIAFSTVAPLFSILYLLTGEASFEATSYYILVLGVLAAPVCGLSGAFSWKVNYRGKMTEAFRRKITFSALLFVVAVACLIWRTLDPNILIEGSTLAYVYLVMLLSLAPIAAILGHTGGRIVFA